jgi:hypothetical protein
MVLAHLEVDRLTARWLSRKELIVRADLQAALGGSAVVVPEADQLLAAVERDHAIHQGNQQVAIAVRGTGLARLDAVTHPIATSNGADVHRAAHAVQAADALVLQASRTTIGAGLRHAH